MKLSVTIKITNERVTVAKRKSVSVAELSRQTSTDVRGGVSA